MQIAETNPGKTPRISWADILPLLQDASGQTLSQIQALRAAKQKNREEQQGSGAKRGLIASFVLLPRFGCCSFLFPPSPLPFLSFVCCPSAFVAFCLARSAVFGCSCFPSRLLTASLPLTLGTGLLGHHERESYEPALNQWREV